VSEDRHRSRLAGRYLANTPPLRSYTMTATATQTIQPQFRTVDGLSIRLAESEDRATTPSC
jgi:hypothetical protein